VPSRESGEAGEGQQAAPSQARIRIARLFAPHPALAALGPPSPRSAGRGFRHCEIPASHVRVALFIVNNNPETMERSRRSFPATAGSRVSRAQRSTKWCAADPGPFQSVAVPDQRCTASLSLALHRIRDTQTSDAFSQPLFTFQTAHLVPAARFRARGFAPPQDATPRSAFRIVSRTRPQ